MPVAARRASLLFLSLATVCLPVSRSAAQPVPSDPSDRLYRSLDRWEVLGYLGPGFVPRPWSPEVVQAALRLVVERGSPRDREEAERYLEELSRPAFDPRGFADGAIRKSPDPARDEYRVELGMELVVVSELADRLWLTGLVGAGYSDGKERAIPMTEGPRRDYRTSGFNDSEATYDFGLDSVLSYGGARLWAAFSYARASVGPFFENGVILGPQASATPNWGIHGEFGPWRFSTVLHQLIARDENGVSLPFDKYLVLHTYSLSVGRTLDLGFYEAVIWAGAFKPLYLVPFSYLFYLQSLTTYTDNSLAGLYVKWRPVEGLLLKAVGYFDDVHAADLASFRFDTKIIGAVQGGIAWVPPRSAVRMVELDYTGVFPYMYAHWVDGTTPVWNGSEFEPTWLQNNYTHAGEGFGSSLPPNSDRWELRVSMEPMPGLTLDLLARLMRHGNASAGITSGDGSIYDDGWDAGLPTYQPPYEPGTDPKYFRFLTQDVLETTAQAGFTVSYDMTLGAHSVTVRGRYLFEYVWNADLNPNSREVNHYLGLDTTIRYLYQKR